MFNCFKYNNGIAYVPMHYSTQGIWDIVCNRKRYSAFISGSWYNGLIGVDADPIVLPVINEGYGVSIDDIINCQPMTGYVIK